MSSGLRLKGTALSVLRATLGAPIAAGPIWSIVRDQMGVAELAGLANTFPEAEKSAKPIAGAPKRSWTDDGFGPPSSKRVTARRLRDAYATGRVSPVEIIDQLSAKIAAKNFHCAHHSPFVELDLEVARIAADRSLMRYQNRAPLGAVDGIPISIKNEQDLEGLPTRAGTNYRGRPPAKHDAHLVAQLRRSGAAIFAATHMSEWGLSPIGINPHHPMPRNVYDRGRAAGGSSTGSGVAVALGYGPLSSGTDAGGSIRTPACLNGIFGLKPTLGRLGRTGSALSYASMTHLGPLGQSTEDLVDYLEAAIREADPLDERSGWPSDQSMIIAECRRALGRGIRGCRIGVPLDAWRTADPAIMELGKTTLKALEADGATLVRMEQPLAKRVLPIAAMVLGEESLHGPPGLDLDQVGDDVAVSVLMMKYADAADFEVARRARTALRRDLAFRISQVDVIALPTTATVAPEHPLDDDGQAILDEAGARAMTRFAFLANLTGVPAGTVPMGMISGLPAGLQIVGDAWDEASVVAVMAAVERRGITDLPPPPGYLALI